MIVKYGNIYLDRINILLELLIFNENKKIADDLLKNKFYKKAIKLYDENINKIEKYIETLRDDNLNIDKCDNIKVKCLNNKSICFYESNNYHNCIKDCDSLLDCDLYSDKLKLYLRKGASYLCLWKNDKTNKNYLQNAINSYKNASVIQSKYQKTVEKLGLFLNV